jgi:DNA polymerase V
MAFALVDCESFYASCERVFRPDLKNIPIVVLSNNDGCVIARSTEAKKMGIAMGVPWFKVRELFLKMGKYFLQISHFMGIYQLG